MIPFDLHTIWPNAVLLAPLALALLLLFWMLYQYRIRLLQKANFTYIDERSEGIFWIKSALLALAWIALTIAVMHPVGNGHYPETTAPQAQSTNNNVQLELKRKAHDVIFLVDASASMNIPDARQGKTRLDNAKEIGDEIIRTLKGENVALYAFTSRTTEISPLTMDSLFVRFMLSNIQINEGGFAGTNFTEALGTIRRKFFSTPSKRLKTLIILSDGGDTTIEALEGNARRQAINVLTSMFSDAAQQHLRVFTVGIGSSVGGIVPDVTYEGKSVSSKLQPEILQRLAESGRGNYYSADKDTSMHLAEVIHDQMNQDPQYDETKPISADQQFLQDLLGSTLVYNRYFQLPLGIALLLLAWIFFWPDSRKRRNTT